MIRLRRAFADRFACSWPSRSTAANSRRVKILVGSRFHIVAAYTVTSRLGICGRAECPKSARGHLSYQPCAELQAVGTSSQRANLRADAKSILANEHDP